MQRYVLPILYALFVWWASTGLIIWLYRRQRATFGRAVAAATALLLVSLWGLYATRNDASPAGAYAAFTCGTLVWGWQLLAFYTGWITGPSRSPCPPGSGPALRFRYALGALLHHELASLAAAALILGLTWGGANQTGSATYLLLWVMHLAAKLNIFFGVRTFEDQLLPEHLGFLRSLYIRRPMNAFFPPAIAIALIVTMLLFGRGFAPDAPPFESTGALVLAVMMLLGVAELALLMLPAPTALWAALQRWLRRPGAPAEPVNE
ncbi:MAG TPA: putative photosynthetic complex assembly protein PuhE [Roseiflexaceae bacterium]|nr:putative photosynthetic complex assembly protein PuhE [Roseiflexaceae bacterium]